MRDAAGMPLLEDMAPEDRKRVVDIAVNGGAKDSNEQGDEATAAKISKLRQYMLSNPQALRFALRAAVAREIKKRRHDGTAAATSA
jgi:hypothetical protein